MNYASERCAFFLGPVECTGYQRPYGCVAERLEGYPRRTRPIIEDGPKTSDLDPENESLVGGG